MAKDSKIVTIDDANPEAPVTPAAVEKEVVQVSGSNFDPQLSGKKVKIEISEGEGDGGRDAVFVQVNGFGYQIPRNKIVSVPAEVYQIVKDAKYTISSKEGDKVVDREVKRFSFQYHGEVTE